MSKITTAHDIRIEEFLNYPELRIPMFQREYVWNTEQIEDFWSDLTEEGIKFLGSIILKDEYYNHDTQVGHLDIVDGQQRTISILLLLRTISRRLLVLAKTRKNDYEINAERQADEINRLISKRDRTNLTKVLSYKLSLPNEEDNKVFKDILDGNSLSKNKLYKNFYGVQEKLEKLLDEYLEDRGNAEKKVSTLVELKNNILDIKIIEVLVPTDEDAYMIFEAVNDRGADLGAAELLKNHLFAYIKQDQKSIHEEWSRIKKTLIQINRRSIDITGFLRYYWIGKYEHLSKRALFKGIKKRITSKVIKDQTTPETILREISLFREVLEKIYIWGLDDWQSLFDNSNLDDDKRQVQRRAIEWFSYKRNLDYFPKSIQYLPIYTAIIGNLDKIGFTERSFIDLLLSIEKINFLYSYILQKPTNKIDKMLSSVGRDVLKKISENNDKELRRCIQSSVQIIEKFLNENIKKRDVDDAVALLNYNKPADKQIIYFILTNLEYAGGGYGRLMVIENLTLEHVYPKSVEKKGKVSGWPVLDFDYSLLGHGLGNLTLLPHSGPQANGAAGEDAFEIKRDNYLLPSTYALNRYFENIEDWGSKEIENRLVKIQDLVWKRWGPKI